MLLHDIEWMRRAISLAQQARENGEVPVGAVLIQDQQLIAAEHNQPISQNDPTAHAEILVLRAAGKLLQNYRFLNTTLYVTLEPCPMCAAALVHARVARVVFGASDPKTGAAGSVFNLLQSTQLNHQLEITSGVLAEECGTLLQSFFRERR